MERITLFADVLLPLPVPGAFTYRVPYALNDQVKTGIRVVVQFGPRKIYTALVLRLHEVPPQDYVPKYILSLLDELPVVNELQLKFWNWLAGYYLCYPGEVMNAALPSALKLASETRIALHPDPPEGSMDGIGEREQMLMEALRHRKVIEISEVARILDLQKCIPVIRNLIDRELVVSGEELNDPYRPVKEEFIALRDDYSFNEELLKPVFDQLEIKGRKQMELLMAFLRLSRFDDGERRLVTRRELFRSIGNAQSSLNSLVKKGILKTETRVVSRLDTFENEAIMPPGELTGPQSEALKGVMEGFAAHQAVLLHGVTSAGKTEIYIRLIANEVARGKQVLFLLPEIALTTQIIRRLKRVFGKRVGVYHSRFNMHEKVDIYKAVLGYEENEGAVRCDILLGARSALFLPFSNLGLIVVDEEHDPSFKQNDPAPRYNARDAAIYLGKLHGAKVLLGSATPSVESYYNAGRGKYGLVTLQTRYAGMEMPDVTLVDIREAARQSAMKSHFSNILLEKLKEALENQEQAILFQNRRGFSLRLECDHCHWMPMCRNCDVTLVYHKKLNQLRCHYCGFVAHIPEKCPGCGSLQVRMKGFGTEKVEEELSLLLPGARIARMDLDTTRTRHALHQIISDFEQRNIDILVGTQMVTKGLDFDHVSLVSILNADNMLSYPDFRAAERSYQLMAQVSGRSGRKNKRGMVIIQTRQPAHPIIKQVTENDYESMFAQQLAERRKFGYPPLTRLVLIRLRHRDPDMLNKGAARLASDLRKEFGSAVLGPEYPLVSRIMNFYIKNIMFKIGNGQELSTSKSKMMEIIEDFQKDTVFRGLRVIIDVDPQ